jgi:hypothetical protein
MKAKLSISTMLLSLMLLSACSDRSSTGQEVPFQTYTIDQFLKTTSVGGGYFNSDESKLLIHTNESGIFNACSIDIESGRIEPLAESKTESIFAVGYMPDEDSILFTSDRGGNELYHLFLRNPEGPAS